MSCPITHEELEALANERLPEARASEANAHVASCAACRDELDWLRLERMAFEERRADRGDDTSALWDGIERRLAAAPEAERDRRADRGDAASQRGGKQRVFWFGSGFAAAAMAAAVLVLYVRAPGVAEPQAPSASADAGAAERAPAPSPAPARSVDATLTQAESQYAQAIATLEAEFEARRADLPADVVEASTQAFERGRKLIEAAREDAGDDVDARLLVLDAYSSHLHTVQAAMTSLE